jgi:hypothetical protein
VETFLGASSGLSRLLGGVQERVLDGLPSLARQNDMEATGLNDILFDSAGQAFGVFGLGGSGADRDANLGAEGALLGHLVRLPLDGAGPIEPVADVAGHEVTANRDGTMIDSNPFSFVQMSAGDFLLADAGGNDFLQVTAAGDITTLGVLPAQPNPLPFGPPMYQ